MRNKTSTLLAIAALTFSYSVCGQTPPFHQAPPIGQDTSAAILIVVTDEGIKVKTDPTQGPYDGIEDTLVAVQNDSSQTLFSLPLSGALPLFGFDGDGICTVDPPAPGGCGQTGYEGPGVSFSNIDASKRSGIVNFAGGLPPTKCAYFGLEEAISTLCAPISGVPLLKQGGPTAPWRSDIYDGFSPTERLPDGRLKNTISHWGCYLTSCVMLINYHASKQGVAFATTPAVLNTWLKSEVGGYDRDGNVNPKAVERYALQNGVSLHYQGPVTRRDDFVVDNYLCTGNPVLLKVPHGKGHFVLATGQTVVNGTDTFLINDPGFPNSTLAGYNFKYLGVRKFSSSATPPQALRISGHSPIELLITDPVGDRTGLEPVSRQAFSEIPNGSYSAEAIADDDDPAGTDSTPESKVLDLPLAKTGTYLLQVFGTGAGPFNIELVGYDSNGNPGMKTVSGYAGPGTRAEYKIQYADVPGSEIVAVTALDVSPPLISGMPPAKAVLWPPNHKLVQVAVVSASDSGTGVASFDVTGISSELSDPKNPDIVILGTGIEPRVVYLRAERSGNATSRVYTVTATATDGAGNTATATSTWIVPHDQGK